MFNKLREKLKARARYKEVVDERPMAMPVQFRAPPTLQEQVQALMRSEQLKAWANHNGFDTLEEAEDFDIGDGDDWSSPYELEYDEVVGREVTKQEKRMLDESRRVFDNAYSEKVKASRKEKPKKKKEEVKEEESPEE